MISASPASTVNRLKEPARIFVNSTSDLFWEAFSFEPLLGPIEPDLSAIDWVIVGGESGTGFRPMDQTWASQIRDAAVEKRIRKPSSLRHLVGARRPACSATHHSRTANPRATSSRGLALIYVAGVDAVRVVLDTPAELPSVDDECAGVRAHDLHR